jgi:hypothetical protein
MRWLHRVPAIVADRPRHRDSELVHMRVACKGPENSKRRRTLAVRTRIRSWLGRSWLAVELPYRLGGPACSLLLWPLVWADRFARVWGRGSGRELRVSLRESEILLDHRLQAYDGFSRGSEAHVHSGLRVGNDELLAYLLGAGPRVCHRIDLRFPVLATGDVARGIVTLSRLGQRSRDSAAVPEPQVFAQVRRGNRHLLLVLRVWITAPHPRALALALKQMGVRALEDEGVVVDKIESCTHTICEERAFRPTSLQWPWGSA